MLRQLTIELTNACNSACVFCPHRFSTRPVTHMDMGLYTKIIRECARLGFASPDLAVGLCGIGEPLLHPEFRQALSIAQAHGVPIGVGSNGGALSRHIDTLLEFVPAQIVFSVDAVSEAVHSVMRPGVGFQHTVTAIEQYLGGVRKAKHQPNNLWVQILVAQANVHEVGSFVEHWLPKLDGIRGGKIFIKCLCPSPYHAANTMYPSPVPDCLGRYAIHPRVDIADFAAPVTFRASCVLFNHFLQVQSDGAVVACCMLQHDPWHLGNVADHTLESIFTSPAMQRLRNTPKHKLEFCKDCI